MMMKPIAPWSAAILVTDGSTQVRHVVLCSVTDTCPWVSKFYQESKEKCTFNMKLLYYSVAYYRFFSTYAWKMNYYRIGKA